MGKGAISDRLPQSLFCIGSGFKDYVREAVEVADLVVTVGYDIAEYPPDRWNPTGDKTIVDIDVTAAEVYSRYQAAVEIVGDVNATLLMLNDRLQSLC